ncbi:uncharacterized protein LOC126971281 isoform X2 [Leptidea sinapis]|uniref:uncharacterized protein LOC126971281 isoform X2 n=1 Tax=Leptidea sinapis TaxID=189913 RepID=UPI002136C8C4|nr:uncharacterized protein LOC126971281 isoform X2 [Leptidea sinapis]
MVTYNNSIGIAICINSLVRAVNCCTIAAISVIYVVHSVSDSKLPYTYCRDFDLKPYDPIVRDVSNLTLREFRFSLATGEIGDDELMDGTANGDELHNMRGLDAAKPKHLTHKIMLCKEEYSSGYPVLYSTPAYNFFYVEVVSYRSEHNFGQFNMPLVLSIIFVWLTLWGIIISERWSYGRLIWNNMYSWLVIIPWLWSILLLIISVLKFCTLSKDIRKVYRIGVKEIVWGIADALEVALFVHSASTGTELIHGKGLNHYASGHIDPALNGENVWHSGLLVVLTGLHSSGAAVCALVDYIQPNTKAVYNMYESTLWMIPMYSKCMLVGNYSHFLSALIFGGLSMSYMIVAYTCLKTALHTIFEYNVKLVFAEQIVVAGTVLSCFGLSLVYTTTGGIALLESVDAIMTGVTMPLICLLELVAILYLYRSPDFISDMNIATEENACSTRLQTQWQIMPIITCIALVLKAIALSFAEMPQVFVVAALVPLVAVLLSVPLKAAHNAYKCYKRAQRNRT